MTQLSIFDPRTKARRNDPETSRLAAQRAGELAECHKRSIMDYLDGIYPLAASYEDISKATGIEKHAVGRRMLEMVNEGRAVVSGRIILSTGRSGQTWRAKIQ